jgi:long-subunit acyl-CoA synthetase (AMP-forming)
MIEYVPLMSMFCYDIYSLVTVPLYDTLGKDALEHVAKQAELSVIFSTSDKASFYIVKYM